MTTSLHPAFVRALSHFAGARSAAAQGRRVPADLLIPRFELTRGSLELSEWRPKTYEYDFTMATDPERAFAILTGEDPELRESWFPDHASTTWLTGAPHGPGSRREYRTRYLTLVEEIDVWQPGRAFAFWVSRASWPLHARFREIYDLSPRGGATRVRWTVAYEPHPRIAWLTPVGHRLFRGTFDRAVENLEGLFSV